MQGGRERGRRGKRNVNKYRSKKEYQSEHTTGTSDGPSEHLPGYLTKTFWHDTCNYMYMYMYVSIRRHSSVYICSKRIF